MPRSLPGCCRSGIRGRRFASEPPTTRSWSLQRRTSRRRSANSPSDTTASGRPSTPFGGSGARPTVHPLYRPCGDSRMHPPAPGVVVGRRAYFSARGEAMADLCRPRVVPPPAAPRGLALLAWLWLLAAVPFLTNTGCFFLIGLLLAFTWLVLGLAC